MVLVSPSTGSSVDPLLSLLIGAFGAAALTGGAGFVGAWLRSRREATHWVREQRMEAYLRFLRVADRMPRAKTRSMEYINELKDALAEISLLGPDNVVKAGSLYMVSAILRSEAPRTIDDEDIDRLGLAGALADKHKEALKMIQPFTDARIAYMREAQIVLGISKKRV